MDNNIKFNTAGGMHGGIDADTGDFQITQDATPFIEQAKRDREVSGMRRRDVGYKKACTIPDIVAIDILTKHGIDVHDPMFMHNPTAVKKVMQIMRSEYPKLMSY